MSAKRKKAPSRARRIPTAVIAVAALLVVSVAAFAYARSDGGTTAPPPCHRVEVGVSNCLSSRFVAHTGHRSIGDARSPGGPLRDFVHRARGLGVPADCNGLCPEGKQREAAEAVAAPGSSSGSSSSSSSARGKARRAAGVATHSATGTESAPASGSTTGNLTETLGGACGLGTSSAVTVAMYAPACLLSASDLASAQNPLSFWGKIDCAAEERYAYVEGGGDTHLSATGEQTDGDYRKVTVIDGDEDSGERCELGENSTSGPTAFYHEDENVLTYFSEKLPSNFPLNIDAWQVTMQMKQAQPSHDDGSGVALEMESRDGHWIVSDLWHQLWSFPAQSETWTRFAWNVYYSKDPEKGWVQVSVDLNGDGDFDDPGERSPVLHAATLATELPEYAEADGIEAGSGIPSHLRMGIYHDESIPCPAPVGCSVDLGNVQIVRPLP